MALAMLAALTLVALWQVRGAAAANALAVALVPAALSRLFPVADGRPLVLGLGRAAWVAAVLLNPLTMIAIGAAGARAVEFASGSARPTVIADGPGTCRRAADYAPLRALAPGRVLGFIDAGPFVLMETPHAVLAAPYHRNIAGNTAMLDTFLSPPDAARLIGSWRRLHRVLPRRTRAVQLCGRCASRAGGSPGAGRGARISLSASPRRGLR